MGHPGRGRGLLNLCAALILAVLAAGVQTAAAGRWSWWTLVTSSIVGVLGAPTGGRVDAWFDARRERARADEAEIASLEEKRAQLVAIREPTIQPESRTNLLRPESGFVPFVGRRNELARLRSWCDDNSANPVFLITGPGGFGKTRLALELIEEMRAAGWRCETTVQENHEVELLQTLLSVGDQAVLLVDYADTRANLQSMLIEIGRLRSAGDSGQIRILLIAREAGDWWDLLGADVPAVRSLVQGAHRIKLAAPLSDEMSDEETTLNAVSAFAAALGEPVPEVSVTTVSDTPLPALVLHATALVAVLDAAQQGVNGVHAVAELGVLDELLGHEQRLWIKTAERKKLGADVKLLKRAVAALALLGAETESMARADLRRVPELSTASHERLSKFANWVHELYPGRDGWVEPLRPDLVAESYIVNQLVESEELAISCIEALDEARAVRVLTLLNRASTHHDKAADLINFALRRELSSLAHPAIVVSIQTGLVIGELLATVIVDTPISLEELKGIADAIPSQSLSLAAASAAASRRVYELLSEDADLMEVAYRSHHLAISLDHIGQREEALEIITKAVQFMQDQQEADPIMMHRLLNDQSTILAHLGRRSEALDANSAATQIIREIVESGAEEYESELAGALNNRSLILWNLGHEADAVAAIVEATSTFRGLVSAQPDNFSLVADLAGALSNLSMMISSDAERGDVALKISSEAVTNYRKLAARFPDLYRRTLAISLNSQAHCFMVLRQFEDALRAIDESLDIRATLPEENPSVSLPDVGKGLCNRAGALMQLHRPEEALISVNMSIDIFQSMKIDHPAEYMDNRENLANAYYHKAGAENSLWRERDALRSLSQVVRIRRDLAMEYPARYAGQLIDALAGYSIMLGVLGRKEEASRVRSEVERLGRDFRNAGD